ncbi:TRAP transporter small permease [Brevibacillus borstelensis]|jgi:TRAP-type C4-dicarboxylate transport system permease small subunit|uniref:Tripartite ATP-independent periplasmic transporter dctq component n=1 Tax=Brevibacillus borstelensis AK1 TaxID=1300222 RepID=M8E8E4_9BACL|nr:TRAP transporter small permease [Brevibacillus borstelensis]EMT51750.1 tripartite ATP-independent periplasmic transporter dctq component [Brevibacillus borstelensis AK1]MBE5397214.1 TRAP transporter small permease [Brevibacillus borstelensis]MCC0564019.1 TRAP transporter small permease [Brevibacillus borstelensis]MCM3470249.1 TRAP transporter small permease [Brevibacillus borstelensis]MCM3558161.1 TRAP transporter small permease [Brevibacillus borstelensis]
MKALSDLISTVEKYLAIVLMFAMAVIVALAVVFRYVLNAPLSWAGEVSIFLLIWSSFIGGSLGLKYKSQAAVTIVLEYATAKVKKMAGIAGHILMLVFLAVMLYYSYTWVLSPGVAFQKSTAILLPMWIPFSAVPVGLTFSAIHLLSNLIELIREEEFR